ncbi:MAG TPA: hypothetical protein VES66_08810 [Terriglobales bacterium]|nr:hypothetical protein [Terriglobales bacterium]
MRGKQFLCVVVMAVSLPAGAQVAGPTGGKITPARPAAASAIPVTAPDNVSPLLAQIQSAARTTTADVSLLNIRKWKVANDVKNDAETKAEAIQRNLVVALPTIVAQVQASPNDFAANFKLYRNLGVLYDVISSLAESAGAFGSKNEFEPLASDLNRIDQARRALGDRLESLASAKDAEVAQLRNQVNAARTAASAPPKKIIVDDDEKKPAKKTTKKKPPAAAATQASPAQPSNPQ